MEKKEKSSRSLILMSFGFIKAANYSFGMVRVNRLPETQVQRALASVSIEEIYVLIMQKVFLNVCVIYVYIWKPRDIEYLNPRSDKIIDEQSFILRFILFMYVPCS